jgi:hypothetical protein
MAEPNRIQDWNPPERPRRPSAAAGLPLIAAAAGAAVVWALLGPVPALLAVGGVGAGFALWWGSQGSRMLRRLRARPARDARLMNLVAGLAGKLGRPIPDVFEADAPPNAFAVPHSKRGAIVVSDSLLESATRTELEAVVAACLVRLDDPSFRRVRWIALVGRGGPGDGIRPRRGGRGRDPLSARARRRRREGLPRARSRGAVRVRRGRAVAAPAGGARRGATGPVGAGVAPVDPAGRGPRRSRIGRERKSRQGATFRLSAARKG